MKARKFISKLLLVIIISSVGVTVLTGVLVFNISTNLVSNSRSSQTKEFPGDNKIESTSIPSTFKDHDIPFDYIYAKNVSDSDNKTMILVHGLGGNRTSVYSKAKFFANQGYNVIAYDQRCSGENEAKYTTFGYYEREDISDLVVYIRTKTNKDIGLWGSSFGGATVGLSLGIDSVARNVSFAILDCPVSNMRGEIRYQLEKQVVPLPVSYIMYIGNKVNKLMLGFSYNDADARKTIKNTDIPILIVNTKADETTPYPMGTDIYNKIKHDKKDILTVDDAKHAKVWKKYKKEYKEKIKNFIQKNT